MVADDDDAAAARAAVAHDRPAASAAQVGAARAAGVAVRCAPAAATRCGIILAPRATPAACIESAGGFAEFASGGALSRAAVPRAVLAARAVAAAGAVLAVFDAVARAGPAAAAARAAVAVGGRARAARRREAAAEGRAGAAGAADAVPDAARAARAHDDGVGSMGRGRIGAGLGIAAASAGAAVPRAAAAPAADQEHVQRSGVAQLGEGEGAAGEEADVPVVAALARELVRAGIRIGRHGAEHREGGGAAAYAAGLAGDPAVHRMRPGGAEPAHGARQARRAGDGRAVKVPLEGIFRGAAGGLNLDAEGRRRARRLHQRDIRRQRGAEHGQLVAFAATPDNEAFTHVISPPLK